MDDEVPVQRPFDYRDKKDETSQEKLKMSVVSMKLEKMKQSIIELGKKRERKRETKQAKEDNTDVAQAVFQ